MKMKHTKLLDAIGETLKTWQTAAQGAGCTLTQVNLILPEGSGVAAFFYLEQEGIWDVDTGRANTEGVQGVDVPADQLERTAPATRPGVASGTE